VIITLTTDFGLGTYVASMKGVILEIDPDAKVVDVDHSVAPQDIRQGAYALYSAAPWFPFAIHIGVVDPGVGTERRGIVIACEGAMFVGPDNGLLIPAAETFGIKEVHKITSKEYTLRRASYVFHGRDVFAPVAAHLSKGVKLRDIGPAIKDYVKLDFGTPQVDDAGIRGEVLTVDRFGNIVTNIIGGYDIRLRLFRTYGEAPEEALLATMSSSNFLEVAKRNGSAASLLNAKPRMPVTVRAAT